MLNSRIDKYIMVHPPNGIQYYGKNRINGSQEQKARRNLRSKSCMEGKQAAGGCMGCYSSYTRHSAAHLFRDTNPCVKPQGGTGTTGHHFFQAVTSAQEEHNRNAQARRFSC